MMADQLIYLDVGDGIAEIVGRLKSVKLGSAVLVIPKRAAISHSPVNLKVIRAACDDLNLKCSVISQDEVAKQFAKLAGLTVVEQQPEAEVHERLAPPPSPPALEPKEPDAQHDVPIIKYRKISPEDLDEDEAAFNEPDTDFDEDEPDFDPEPNVNLSSSTYGKFEARAPKPKRQINFQGWKFGFADLLKWRPKRHHQVLFGFLAIGLMLLGTVGFFVVPKAYVAIEVQSEPFNKQFTITLADEQDLKAVGAHVLTGRFIEVSREDVSTFPATGEENRGEKAHGQIRIVNHTRTIQGIIANTRFQAPDGTVFRINSEVLVAPASGGTPGLATVAASSEEGGSNKNVSAPLKLSIPGLGEAGVDLVYGEIVGTFTGGTDEITKIVSEEDIEKAKEEATKNIFVAAETEITSKLKRGEALLPILIQNDIIDAVPSATAGAKRDEFEVRVQSRSWVIAADREDINRAIANAALFEVPEGKQVTDKTVRDAKVEVVESNFLTREIKLLVTLEGRVGPKLDQDGLALDLTSKSVAEATSLLQSSANVANASVELAPPFLTRTPMLVNNIRVQVIYLGE